MPEFDDIAGSPKRTYVQKHTLEAHILKFKRQIIPRGVISTPDGFSGKPKTLVGNLATLYPLGKKKPMEDGATSGPGWSAEPDQTYTKSRHCIPHLLQEVISHLFISLNR